MADGAGLVERYLEHVRVGKALSPRTVEMHRARLMKKFAAGTSSELVNRLLGGLAT